MRSLPLRNHFLVFSLVLAGSFSLFTLAPTLFPHPEDFSPYAYVVAFIACAEVWFLVKDNNRKWFLLPVLLLCLLALLDETGYGSEILDIPPIYSQSLHTEIRDLHNLIGIAFDLTSQALGKANWDGGLFTTFFAIDGLLLVFGFFFGWLLHFRMPLSEEKLRRGILWLIGGFWFAIGLTTAVFLLGLPQDPTNDFLLGYSATRLTSTVIALLISVAPLAMLIYQRKTRFLKKVESWLTRYSRPILIFCLLLVLAGFAYQIYAPFVFLPDQKTRLERITPLVMWLLFVAWILLLGIYAWRGGLREPLVKLIYRFADFLRQEPAYFYTGCAVLLIVVAQLIDQDVIPLNTLIWTPNFHIRLWGLWTEETFEMIGAFLFVVAAFYFPKTK